MKKTFPLFFIGVMVLAALFHAQAEVNYDTAWTYVYDGGRTYDDWAINDLFKDITVAPNGDVICLGNTRDSNYIGNILLVRLSPEGSLVWKKQISGTGGAITVARNGDFIIGGDIRGGPMVLRTDSEGNELWRTWYYDSLEQETRLYRGVYTNDILENRNGEIVCIAGDDFPWNSGNDLNNYAAFLRFDSNGVLMNTRQWSNEVGNKIAGFHINETLDGDLLLSGNQSVFYLDSTGNPQWRKTYSFWLEGVGTVVNNVIQAKMLRDGTMMAAGQAYEGECWVRWQRFYYDAWWSPLNSAGNNISWDTAGTQQGSDYIFDFAQLEDGNIVFVGNKHNFGSDSGGIWTFVTDSTGKQILWEKQTKFAYETYDGRRATPLSVVATPDGGFTIAGQNSCTDAYGGLNALVAHYKITIPTAVQHNKGITRHGACTISKLTPSQIVFSFQGRTGSSAELNIFSAAGRRVASVKRPSLKAGANSISWKPAGAARGVYFYTLEMADGVHKGKFIID